MDFQKLAIRFYYPVVGFDQCLRTSAVFTHHTLLLIILYQPYVVRCHAFLQIDLSRSESLIINQSEPSFKNLERRVSSSCSTCRSEGQVVAILHSFKNKIFEASKHGSQVPPEEIFVKLVDDSEILFDNFLPIVCDFV